MGSEEEIKNTPDIPDELAGPVVYEKRFASNFLSYKKYGSGVLVSLALLVLCMLASLAYWKQSPIGLLLAASPESVFEKGEWWRLFTTSFVHGDMEHLLSNSFSLFYMSFFTYSHYGFKIYPVLSFIMGIAINALVIMSYKQNITLVGASGVVYFLWGFWLVLYILIQRHLSLSMRILKALGVGIIILFPTSYQPTTSYLAHGLGFLIGSINAIIYYLINRKNIQSFERNKIVAT